MELPPVPLTNPNAPQILTMQPDNGQERSATSRLRRRGILTGVFICLFLVVFFGGSAMAAFAAYTFADIPFLSKDQENAAAIALYHVPFLPKTPKQILLVASASNTQLTTYTPEFSMSGTIGASSISAASFDINIAGPVDFSPGKSSVFDLSVQGGINFAGTSYEVAGKMRKVNNLIYGKIDLLSDSILELVTSYLSFGGSDAEVQQQRMDEIKRNLASFFHTWISYDTGSIQSEARKALDARGSDQSLIESTRKKTNELLLQQTVLGEIKKMPDETVGEIDSYHLQLIPSKETMRRLLIETYPKDQQMTESALQNINQALDAISSLQIDVWFGKKDSILRKLSVQTSVKLDAYTQPFRTNMNSVLGSRSDLPISPESIVNPVINTSVVLLIKDIGKPVNVELPQPILNSQEYMKGFQNALKTKEQQEQDAVRSQFDQDMKSVSSALLKYYVTEGSYPATLSTLAGQGLWLSSTDPASKSLGKYSYKRSSDGRGYILYIESQASPFAQTPYYGITSDRSFPHQLSQEDFDRVR